MLKMSVGGNIVDLAKCAARYASFGSTDDSHDTYHSLFTLVCSHFHISSLTFFASSLSNSKT